MADKDQTPKSPPPPSAQQPPQSGPSQDQLPPLPNLSNIRRVTIDKGIGGGKKPSEPPLKK